MVPFLLACAVPAPPKVDSEMGETATDSPVPAETGDTAPVDTGDTADTASVDTSPEPTAIEPFAKLTDGVVDAEFVGEVVGTADVDGDGASDVVVGSPRERDMAGAAYVVAGPPVTGGVSTLAVASYPGASDGDLAGFIATAHDVTGDGIGDLVVADFTAPGPLLIIFGPTSGVLDPAMADADYWGNCAYAGCIFPESVDFGDTDGDGIDDLLIQGGSYSSGTIMRGPAATSDDVDADAVAWMTGPVTMILVRDLDGDGSDELVTLRWETNSAVELFEGPLAGELVPGDGDASWGYRGDYHIRTAVSGDFDGDGRNDLAIGAPGGTWDDNGAAYVLFDLATTDNLDHWPDRLDGYEAGYTGSSLVSLQGAGDAGGDALVVGCAEATGGADGEGGPGTVYIHTTIAGVRSVADAPWSLAGADGDDNFGFSVAAGDLDGDGIEDLLVGAIADDDAGPDAGAIFAFSGAGRW